MLWGSKKEVYHHLTLLMALNDGLARRRSDSTNTCTEPQCQGKQEVPEYSWQLEHKEERGER